MMLDVAISPCPNDTFSFYFLLQNKHAAYSVSPHYHDIQTLNELAIDKKMHVSKVSCNTLQYILDDYLVLPVGITLGFGMGPKIISKKPFPIEELPSKSLAIPGKLTTAHMLLDSLCPAPKEKKFCLYHEVLDLVEQEKVDAGIILHETRFTFRGKGFNEICDLGQLWENAFKLPLPLGCIVAKRNLKEGIIDRLTEDLYLSLQQIYKTPEAAKGFIIERSQEKDPSIVQKHIDLYVNEESLEVSDIGLKAFDKLFELQNYSPPKGWYYERHSCFI
ncbi:MAG: hypothetical protein GWP59_04005 [Chlamydiales bacterium]|nr:1,4-dihydroxy-6-naphthoate synthase [Chlamydiales bacterium]NCF70847.1 hypothetical protein [Chlamydiales bacterium]